MLKMINDKDYNNALRKQVLRKCIKFHQIETNDLKTPYTVT